MRRDLSHIRRIDIEIQSYCNRQCDWCPNKFLDRTFKEEMSDNTYSTLLKQLKEANALRYDGFLDEDFLPHVDAFWKGVFDILELISVNNRVSLVLPKIDIDEKFESKVRRKIASKDFLVTNEKIDRLQKLIEEIENNYKDK